MYVGSLGLMGRRGPEAEDKDRRGSDVIGRHHLLDLHAAERINVGMRDLAASLVPEGRPPVWKQVEGRSGQASTVYASQLC